MLAFKSQAIVESPFAQHLISHPTAPGHGAALCLLAIRQNDRVETSLSAQRYVMAMSYEPLERFLEGNYEK